jgi:hypothetical protein
MSYTMTVKVSRPPNAAAVLSELGRDVRGGEGLGRGDWPERLVHLHRARHSTRGITIERKGTVLSVRMAACTNWADWDLAFSLFDAVDATPIEGEDATTVALVDGRAGFAEVMARELWASVSTLHTVIEPRREVQLTGTVRDVFVGRRMLREIGRDPVAMLERIRRVQYIEDAGFEFVTHSNLSATRWLTAGLGFSLWNPKRPQAFGPTTHLALTGARTLHVPLAALPEVVGSRFAWLDEKQFTIAATPEAEIAQLVERAERVAFDPYAKLNKKWWQFWR